MNAKESYKHAFNVLKAPFPEGEAAIATSASYSFYYALNVLKSPFQLGEKTIAKDSEYSHRYAKDILKATFALNVNGAYTTVDVETNKGDCDEF